MKGGSGSLRCLRFTRDPCTASIALHGAGERLSTSARHDSVTMVIVLGSKAKGALYRVQPCERTMMVPPAGSGSIAVLKVSLARPRRKGLVKCL